MPDKFYDVVVLGRSLGALTASALLARRDFTVLHLGQGQRAPSYQVDRFALRRSAHPMIAATSPAWLHVLGELAHSQSWRRRIEPLAPMLQVLMPGRRFDLAADADLFRREVEREFPEVRRLIHELGHELARVTAAADEALGRDAVWPPGTFLERRETGRAAASLPYARGEPHADLLAEFPRGHPYRYIVRESVRFATDLATPPPAFATARLHGLATRAPVRLRGGEQELEQILCERIELNGGRVELGERAAELEVGRGSVIGVKLDGEVRSTSAGYIITDLPGEELAALAAGAGISKRAQREWPRVLGTAGRFVVSVVARRAGVPAALGPESLLVSGDAEPAIHLVRAETERPDETLLVAEMLITERDPVPLRRARARTLERLAGELPFLERHLCLVDSVHDGLPVWRFEPVPGSAAARQELARGSVPGLSVKPEPMEKLFDVDPPGYLGLGGEPVRGPIERTLLVGPTVLPGLGQEGRILAGVSAARLVTQRDKRKARMRREMWTKIEVS
ncbi:MAG: phytoene dehydrogenase [Polyangiaceae bacterium]|nr:phytoene dehydrogenase [Polyangiaceae bacterium]